MVGADEPSIGLGKEPLGSSTQYSRLHAVVEFLATLIPTLVGTACQLMSRNGVGPLDVATRYVGCMSTPRRSLSSTLSAPRYGLRPRSLPPLATSMRRRWRTAPDIPM